jgi:hypothetical protein
MAVVAEYFFRPRNRLTMFLARLIGAPTCGVLRGGPDMHKLGDPYDVAMAFVARDHRHAELEALPGRTVRPSDLKGSCAALAAAGMSVEFKRLDKHGNVRKVVTP